MIQIKIRIRETVERLLATSLQFENPSLRKIQKSMSSSKGRPTITEEISKRAQALKSMSDLGPLVDSIKDSKIVMLGEASHGTQEFYYWRRLISQELIENHGFQFIGVEGDWPPCQKVNQAIRSDDGKSIENVLGNFRRWPTWMWANSEVQKLIRWMRRHNHQVTENQQVGFYGLDVYSMFESIDESIQQAQKIDPQMAERLRARYACFDPYQQNEKAYLRSLVHFPEGCEEQALRNLKELLELRLRDSEGQKDFLFDAIQNARIVKNAEHYYRSMIHGDEESWNIRDQHMMETLTLLNRQLGKGIVWEHNTHIGDYRATDMAEQGHINIGGLAREKWGEKNVSLVGFGTYQGTVIASHAWGGRRQALLVPEAAPNSYESLFHSCISTVGSENYYLLLDAQARQTALADWRGHRAIGVVYDPSSERRGNYVPTSLAHRYDAFVFLDQTEALSSLENQLEKREIPETFPSGM